MQNYTMGLNILPLKDKKVIRIIVFIVFFLLLSYFVVDFFKLINKIDQYKKPLATLKIKEQKQENERNSYIFYGEALYVPTSEIVCLLKSDMYLSWSSLIENNGTVFIEGIGTNGSYFYKREVTEHNIDWAITAYNEESALRFQFMKPIYPSCLIIKVSTEVNDIGNVEIMVYPVIAKYNGALVFGIFIIVGFVLILIVLSMKFVRKF